MVHLEPLFLIIGSYIILIFLNFKFKEPLFILAVVLIKFRVKNQAHQVSFQNSVVGYAMSIYSYEFPDFKFYESLNILESISNYGA